MRLWLTGILVACVTLAWAGSVAAETVVVKVRNFEFDPADITIQSGDTVRWEWESGVHTVTSGPAPNDPTAGDLFDVDSNSGAQVFEFVFNDVGLFEYYCEPHFAANMKGTVTVTEGTPVDAVTWGKIKKIFDNTAPTHLGQ